MHRFVFISITYIFSLLILPVTALAQNAVPDFRYITTRDTDFYGSDLDALFDTDLKSCIRACSANDRCTAFTYNTRSDACFPKDGVTRQEAYQGALSAQKLTTSEQALILGKTRAAALSVLGSADLKRATDQARNLGFLHPGAPCVSSFIPYVDNAFGCQQFKNTRIGNPGHHLIQPIENTEIGGVGPDQATIAVKKSETVLDGLN